MKISELKEEILRKLSFLQLVVTNDFIARNTVSYLTIDDFFITVLNKVFECNFEHSYFLKNNEALYEITDKENSYIMTIVMDGDWMTIEEVVEDYIELVQNDNSFEKSKLFIVNVGIARFDFSSYWYRESISKEKSIYFIDSIEIINTISSSYKKEKLIELMKIIDHYSNLILTKFSNNNSKYEKYFNRIFKELYSKSEVPTIIPTSLKILPKSKMKFSDFSSIDFLKVEQIYELYSAYSSTSSYSYELINRVYCNIRRAWSENTKSGVYGYREIYKSICNQLIIDSNLEGDSNISIYKESIEIAVLEAFIREKIPLE